MYLKKGVFLRTFFIFGWYDFFTFAKSNMSKRNLLWKKY